MKAETKIGIYKSIGFSFMIFLIILRYPNFLFQPRFWAEEAIYFEIFYSLENWWQSFNLLIYPAYYLFLSRLGPSLATLLPLEYAPLATSLFGLFVLLIPLIIIFFTESVYWKSIKSKLLISLFYIVCSTTGEVWMTSTNIGFIVPIFIFLILIDENLVSLTKRIFYNSLIFIGAISSPIAMLMAPLFYIKYFFSKSGFNRNYCIIFFVAAIMQLSYYATSSYFGMVAEDRLSIGSWDLETMAGNLLAYNIIFPLFGYFASLLFREFFATFAIGSDVKSFLSAINIYPEHSSAFMYFFESLAKVAFPLLCILLLITIFVSFKIFINASLDKKIYFIGPFIYLSLMLNALSLGALGGFRYSIITSFILLFYLYTLLIDFPDQKNLFVKSLLSISLIIGFLEYYPRVHNYVPNTIVAEKIEWPNWNEEVSVWKLNNSYMPKVWPYIKNKDLIYPAWQVNESNIVCINLEKPQNWERMGSRYFFSSFLEMAELGFSNDSSNKIVHFTNCGGEIFINGAQPSLEQNYD